MSLNQTTDTRIFYLDQLRALAIVGIVICHVANLWNGTPHSSLNWIVHYFFNILGRYGVPVFLMLSGALLLNKDYAIYDFIKRRFPRILKPFIFWMAIAIVFGIITQDKFSIFSSLLTTIIYITKTFLANRWYVWMILGVYLVMPIINDFVKNRGLKGVEYFLSLLVITSILYSISLYFHFPLPYLDLSIFVGPLAYVFLGYYIHKKEFNYAPGKLVILGLSMFAFAVSVKTFLVYIGHFDLSMFFYHSYLSQTFIETDIFAFIQAAGIFLMFKYLNDTNIKGTTMKISTFLKEGVIGRLTISLSRCSYGIYLNHYIFIGLISLLSLNLLKHSALQWIPLLVISILLVSWVLILILDKIPYLNKLSGVH